MRRIAIVGWLFLAVGAVVLGMRTIGVLDGGADGRVEMVSTGATAGDDVGGGASLVTAPAPLTPPTDLAARLGIISVALGILLVVIGSPGPAPSERRLIGT